MNDGIVSISERYVDKITNHGNLPAKPVQTPGKLNNKLDWKSVGSNGWSAISDSIYETIKKSNTFSFLTSFVSKATFPGGILPYVSGLLMSDGKVILCPFNSTTAIIWDPNNDFTIIPGGTYPGSSAYSSAVLLPNGEILFPPRNAACRVYNPVSNTVRIIGSAPTSNAYLSAVLMQDGRVFCAPYSSTTALIIDPINNTTKNATGTFTPGPGGFTGYGAVLLSDGRIFIANNSAGSPFWIYDPVRDRLSSTKTLAPYYSQGCSFLPDEKIMITHNNNNSYPIIFDYKTDTIKIGKTFLTNGPSGGSTLLPDGNILLHYLGGQSIVIYNPQSDTGVVVPVIFGDSTFTNGTVLFDGRFVFYPRNSTSIIGYGVKGISFSKEMLLSAHFNHRR